MTCVVMSASICLLRCCSLDPIACSFFGVGIAGRFPTNTLCGRRKQSIRCRTSLAASPRLSLVSLLTASAIIRCLCWALLCCDGSHLLLAFHYSSHHTSQWFAAALPGFCFSLGPDQAVVCSYCVQVCFGLAYSMCVRVRCGPWLAIWWRRSRPAPIRYHASLQVRFLLFIFFLFIVCLCVCVCVCARVCVCVCVCVCVLGFTCVDVLAADCLACFRISVLLLHR